MSRPLRIDYPNAWHRVMNRARSGQDLFVDRADFQQFADLMQETANLFNVKVAAYCLMPTHKGYLSKAKKWNWLYKHFVLQVLTANKTRQIPVYKQFMVQEQDQVPASKELSPDLDTIISQVCDDYKVKPIHLKTVRRGIENEPRDVAMYLIRSLRAEPLMRVGENFELTQYSSVSSVVNRIKAKLQKDRKFRGRLQNIQSNILKEQT